MSIPSFRRLSVLLLLVLALTVPRARAAGQSRDVRQPETAAQAAPADLLGHLSSFLANVWLKSGCYIDPDGRCAPHLSAPPVSTSQGDSGCYIDPNGRCLH